MKTAYRVMAGLLALLFVSLLHSASTAAQLTTVKVSPEAQIVYTVGSETSVLIEIVEVSDLYGFQLDVTYDPSILEHVSLTQGTFIGDAYWVPLDVSTPGVIRNIAAVRLSPGETVSGSGTLASVTFRAVAEGSSTVGIENPKLADDQACQIRSTAQDGQIRVGEYRIFLPVIVKSYTL